MECPVFAPPAAFADNRPTNCEINRSGPWPDVATQSNRDISSWLHNNTDGRERRLAAPDASAVNESTLPEFPSGDYHTRSLGRKPRRDTTHARPRMHPCRGPTRQFGRRSSRANSSGDGARDLLSRAPRPANGGVNI